VFRRVNDGLYFHPPHKSQIVASDGSSLSPYFHSFLTIIPFSGGALLGAYGVRSPCVRTLQHKEEAAVLRAARSYGKDPDGVKGDNDC
jgi:hypothetical protein